MDYIRIAPDRLKITVSMEELAEYSLSCEDIDSSEKWARSNFKTMLNDIGKLCGIDWDWSGGRLFVQVFASKKGGCEMFVTHLEEDCLSVAVGASTARMKYIYCFDSLSKLLKVCRAAHSANYAADGSAYVDEDGDRWFLSLDREFMPACEFGGVLCRREAAGYISEHCRLVCDSAVSTFSEFA